MKLKEDQPYCALIEGSNLRKDKIDLLQHPRYLKNIKKIDGIKKELFIQLQKNQDSSFKPSNDDSKAEQDRKEMMRIKFDKGRFLFPKICKFPFSTIDP